MSGESSLFVASSARHVLLDAALAFATPAGPHALFLAEHLRAEWMAPYVDVLAHHASSPFDAVHVWQADWRPHMAGVAGLRRRWTKLALKRRFLATNRALVDAEISKRRPAAVFVSCDNFYEAQYVLHAATRARPDVRRVYVEDGSSAYAKSFVRRSGRARSWMRRWRYGSWWRDAPMPGASGWLDEGRVAFPEHVREPLRALRLERFESKLFANDRLGALCEALAERFELDLERVRRADVLLTVANSRWSGHFPDYRARLGKLARELLDRGLRIVVKHHPSDREDADSLGAPAGEQLYVAPQAVPIELMLMHCGERATLLGDASSCMLSARWLRPRMRAVALSFMPDREDTRDLEPVFAAVGVEVDDDIDAALERFCPRAPRPAEVVS